MNKSIVMYLAYIGQIIHISQIPHVTNYINEYERNQSVGGGGIMSVFKSRYSALISFFKRKNLRSPPWLGWPLWNICVTNDHGYVPFVISTSRSSPHSRLVTGFVTRLTRRVPLVEQELLILREHTKTKIAHWDLSISL